MNVRDLITLTSVPGLGPTRIKALIEAFGDASAVLTAKPAELIRVEGIHKKLAVTIAQFKDTESYAEDQLHRANKASARIITLWDDEYPPLLKHIYDPPVLLFVRGSFIQKDFYSISLVGTRTPTHYGLAAAKMLSDEFARMGITTVSGLARGIDTEVHRATLQAGGRTIAFLGSGVDVPYPPENRKMLERIIETGVVASEFPMGAKPDAINFPRRNRLISGTSHGTVVIESEESGGGMITASIALDQGKEVFAVPGAITEAYGRGPNKLIKESRAKLVTCASDVLEDLRSVFGELMQQPRTPEPPVEVSLFEANLLELLTTEPKHIDNIAEAANATTVDVLVTLLSLEFKGLVRQLPGKMFMKM